MKNTKKIQLNIFLLISLVFFLILDLINILPQKLDTFSLQFIGIIATLPVIKSAYQALKNKKISIDLLASIALLVSIFNNEWRSVVFINLMITSARIFSIYSEDKTERQIKSLLKLRPTKVKIKRNNQIIEENLSAVKIGDLIVIEIGDRIPVDGVVVDGEASIDQSSLTGESIPVGKLKGDSVFSSTLNVSGSLLIKAEKIGKDTSFEKIIKLVENAQNSKVGIYTLVEKFSSWYIVLTFTVSIVLFLISKDTNLVLSVLLVTCADDIAVAVPMAFWISVGRAAKRGIIIKGSTFLETITKVNFFVFDKTGTLTLDKIKVKEVITFDKIPKNSFLELAASAESITGHPIAQAVVDYVKNQNIIFSAPKHFKVFPSRGVIVNFQNKNIFAGNLAFFKEQSIKIKQEYINKIVDFESKGYSVVIVGNNKNIFGLFILEGEPKPKINETFVRLKKWGIKRIVMLTGDNSAVAKNIAGQIGIQEFYSNLLPADKLEFVRKNLDKKNKLVFVGDGVNDAASLAQADVGIVMAAIGSDSAIESADVALMDDNFNKIADFVDLGQYTLKIARQNFLIWAIVNAFGLFLVFSKIIGPTGAALFNFVTDFIPLLNSSRIFGFKFSDK